MNRNELRYMAAKATAKIDQSLKAAVARKPAPEQAKALQQVRGFSFLTAGHPAARRTRSPMFQQSNQKHLNQRQNDLAGDSMENAAQSCADPPVLEILTAERKRNQGDRSASRLDAPAKTRTTRFGLPGALCQSPVGGLTNAERLRISIV